MRKITYFQEHNSLYKAIYILFRQINKIVDKNLCTSIYGLLFKAFLKKKIYVQYMLYNVCTCLSLIIKKIARVGES